jgi:sterol desaturase/sphingolipid hydroxylase (fatty acid hydroxylase superfamily)
MRELIGVGIALTLLGAIIGTLQWLWPAVPNLRRTWRELSTDFTYWLLSPLLMKPLARVAVVLALVPLFLLLGRPLTSASVLHGYGPVAAWPGWLQAITVVVLGDFIGYWVHRAFHRGRLWKFHAIHHGSRELTWMSAVRLHPVNDVLTRMAQAVPFVALGFSPLVIAAYLPFLTFYAILLHANLRWDFGPLRMVLASPAFHRWHHADETAARDKNFAGLLPVWDWLFGTLYLPRGVHPQVFGAQGEAVPAGWLAQMAYPFRTRKAISAPVGISPT